MRRWLSRIRGILGTGLTWAVTWMGAGVALWMGFLAAGFPVELAEFVVLFSVTGLVGGVAFAGVLSVAERRRRLGQLSLRRFAAWGGLAGLGVALAVVGLGAWTTGLVFTGVLTTLGAGSAAGSLALARRAERNLLAASEPAGALEGDPV